MESDTVRSSRLTVRGASFGSGARRVPWQRCAAHPLAAERGGARPMSDYLRQTRCAKSSRLLTLRRPDKNPVNLEPTTEDGWLEGKGRRKSRCHPRWIPRRDNTTSSESDGSSMPSSREEGGPEAPGDQWWRHLLIKETRNDPARRATPCPSRYPTFRSLLIGFINRFGGVSVVTEGSFGIHDSGEKDMRFMA